MQTALALPVNPLAALKAKSDVVHLRTERPIQLIDITELVAERVRRSGIAHGLVCVQTLHTTAAILVNENEPLLLEDIQHALERLVPSDLRCAHDDLGRRADVAAAERINGHAHLKALLLSPSTTLSVVEGQVLLGRWQRLFLAELDGGQMRSLAVLVLGVPREKPCWN